MFQNEVPSTKNYIFVSNEMRSFLKTIPSSLQWFLQCLLRIHHHMNKCATIVSCHVLIHYVYSNHVT